MALLLFLSSFVLFDAEAVKTLLDCDEAAWQRLGDETIPPEQDSHTLAQLADKLARWMPRRFWKERSAVAFPPQRGEAVRLEGNITFVQKYDNVYRCKMELNNGANADVFVPSVPQTWQPDLPMRERAAAFGVYVKSYKDIPVFAVPAIEWYPDTWLGNLGFDVASFDRVPVSRVTEAMQNDAETNRLTFKFTESDWEPFYGLLRVLSDIPASWLEQETQKQHTEMPFGVTDLFNRPHETRGKPILLRGTAKRIVPTPVTDGEVSALFGIDRYYQIFLYTEQSQGNPIVVCVRSLPEGMPTGDADDFAEQITVVAVPYKLWIYETVAGQHYAPILVGRSPVWHPQPVSKRLPPESVTAWSFAVFCILVFIWSACRIWARRSHIEPVPRHFL